MPVTDATLLAQWERHGDAEAFKEIATRYAGMVYGTCRRVLGSASDAEDVAQECFIALVERREREIRNLGSWLHGVAVKRALDRLRAESRRREREKRYSEQQPASQEIRWDDVSPYVDEAIAALPERLREPLAAHFLHDQSHEVIAQSLGVSRQTVAYRISKGIEHIRKSLKGRGLSVAAAALSALLATNMAEAAPGSLLAALGRVAVSGIRATAAAGTGASAGVASTIVKSGMFSGGLAGLAKLAAVLVIAGAGAFGVWRLVEGKSGTTPEPSRASRLAADAVASGGKEDSRGVETAAATDEPAGVASPRSGGQPKADVSLREGETTSELIAGATIKGRVYDDKTGKGIAAVSVGGFQKWQAKTPQVETDQTGSYELHGLPAGTYEVMAMHAPGYPRTRAAQRSLTITVEENEVYDGADFAFNKGVRVTGSVIDANGAPQAGAGVAAMTKGAPGGEHATSRSDGSFEVFVPEASDALSVQAATEDFESDVAGPLTLPVEGLDGLVLQLTRPKRSALTGVVVDPSGRPVAKANLHLQRGVSDYLVGSGMEKSGSDGSFKFANIAAGEYGILLTSSEQTTFSERDTAKRVELAEGQQISGLRLVLGGDKGGLSISGRVVDSSGALITDATVTARGPVEEQAHTNETGSFEITGLEEGIYDVHAMDDLPDETGLRCGPGSARNVQAGARDIEIVLHRPGKIEGRVIRADSGKPLTEFDLFVAGGGHSQLNNGLFLNGRNIRDAEGRFSCGFYAGPVTVTAQAPGFAPAFKSVELHEKETISDFELRLEPGLRLTGKVADSLGNPVAGAKIFFNVPQQGEQNQPIVQADEAGVFVIDAMSPDVLQLSAYQAGYAPGTARVEEGMVIVLDQAGIITGSVFRNGEQTPRAFVRVEYPDRNDLPSCSSGCQNDGVYRIADLPAGRVVAHAQVGAKQQISREALVEAGKTTQLDFPDISGTGRIEGRITVKGAPSEGAHISVAMVSPEGESVWNPDMMPDGTYVVDKVPAGQGQLEARVWSEQEGFALSKRQAFQIEDGQCLQLDMDFSGTGAVSGSVLGLDSSMRAGIVVLLGNVPVPEGLTPQALNELFMDNHVAQLACKEDGSFLLDGLEPATYTVVAVMIPEGTTASSPVRLVSSVVEVSGDEPAHALFDFR